MGKEFWGSDPVKANKMKSRIPLGKFAGKVLVNKHIHKKNVITKKNSISAKKNLEIFSFFSP